MEKKTNPNNKKKPQPQTNQKPHTTLQPCWNNSTWGLHLVSTSIIILLLGIIIV